MFLLNYKYSFIKEERWLVKFFIPLALAIANIFIKLQSESIEEQKKPQKLASARHIFVGLHLSKFQCDFIRWGLKYLCKASV